MVWNIWWLCIKRGHLRGHISLFSLCSFDFSFLNLFDFFVQISFGDPDELLISINGTYGSLCRGSPRMITSLTFTSNRSRYGPYGREVGTSFCFCFCCPLDAGIVTGFHGRSGDYLYAIGVNRTLLEVAVDQSSRKVEAGDVTVASTIQSRDLSSLR